MILKELASTITKKLLKTKELESADVDRVGWCMAELLLGVQNVDCDLVLRIWRAPLLPTAGGAGLVPRVHDEIGHEAWNPAFRRTADPRPEKGKARAGWRGLGLFPRGKIAQGVT